MIKAPTKIAPQKKPNIVISCYKISLKIKGAIIVVFMQVHDMAKDKILEHFATLYINFEDEEGENSYPMKNIASFL